MSVLPPMRWSRRLCLVLIALLAVRLFAASGEETVRLEAYPQPYRGSFFDKLVVPDGASWRFGRVGRRKIEVLSACDDATTNRFVSELLHELAQIEPLAPKKFLGPPLTPIRLVLYTEGPAQVTEPYPSRMSFFNRWGGENFAAAVNLSNYPARSAGVSDYFALAQSDAFERFRRVWPSRPMWLGRGLARSWLQVRREESLLRFESLAHPDAKAALEGMSVDTLFNDAWAAEMRMNAAVYETWDFALAAFMHWALSDTRRRNAFWRFAEEARTRDVDAALLRRHFGLDFRGIRHELLQHVNRDGDLNGFAPIQTPRRRDAGVSLRPASPEEIHTFREEIDRAIRSQPSL